MRCMRCGHTWDGSYDPEADEERMCPACRSSSVRIEVK
jgi:DNA-directed RNA polymerase subunit RPC12/RpoP